MRPLYADLFHGNPRDTDTAVSFLNHCDGDPTPEVSAHPRVGFLCSSPRKEKYSKSQTGKYVVPHEQISRVNPNGGETRRNPQEGISINRKSQRISDLVPNRINPEVPAGKFQQKSQLAQKGINSEVPAGEFCANGV